MKAIILSVRPEWVAKILNGEKTIEIRKSVPKCDLPIDVYLYCTKAKPLLLRLMNYGWALSTNIPSGYVLDKKNPNAFNGRVLVKFTLNKWQEISENALMDNKVNSKEILEKACLSADDMMRYWGDKEKIYAWHIDNLVIFDTPKPLSEFTTAPQSWCYVEIGGNKK